MNVMEGELWNVHTKTISPEVFFTDRSVVLMPDVKLIDSSFIEKLDKEYGTALIVTWVVDDTDALDKILTSKHRMSMISNHPVHILYHMNKFYGNYCQIKKQDGRI